MQTGSSIDPPSGEQTTSVVRQLRRVLLRKLWLPRFLYEALPYIYISCGLAALVAAAFAPGWTWILPYAILIGLIGLHAGLAIATMRFRFRKRRKRFQRS